jgi:hypothetical protein
MVSTELLDVAPRRCTMHHNTVGRRFKIDDKGTVRLVADGSLVPVAVQVPEEKEREYGW